MKSYNPRWKAFLPGVVLEALHQQSRLHMMPPLLAGDSVVAFSFVRVKGVRQLE